MSRTQQKNKLWGIYMLADPFNESISGLDDVTMKYIHATSEKKALKKYIMSNDEDVTVGLVRCLHEWGFSTEINEEFKVVEELDDEKEYLIFFSKFENEMVEFLLSLGSSFFLIHKIN
jgi:hypothetical protein